jgi:transglutaminase-like putative cysteine protease
MKSLKGNRFLFSMMAAVLMAALCFQAAWAVIEKETIYYGVEISGTLCGYAEIDVSPLEKDGRELMLINQKIFILQSALGMEFDSDIRMNYHVDPETHQYTFIEMDIKQGQMDIHSTALVDGDTIRYSSTLGGDKNIPITPDVLLENPLYSRHLIKDFVEDGKTEASYDAFTIQTGEVVKVVFTKVGTEKIKLAGKKYNALVVDQVFPATNLKIKAWIDVETGLGLKIMPISNRVIYLAKPSVVKNIRTANLDELILTKAGVSIADVTSISYLQVKARIEPVGLVVTPESLNVPGQSFTGTVEDNLIDGVFEISHLPYDGSNPPPFPPDYKDIESLQEYLEPNEFIESADPVLAEEARRITGGAADSWEAAIRLGRWVGENIGYAIPGGVTSRKTYDIKAGECGAHSFLLAAFCRAVGIPARVIWGCTYMPQGGGSFGQHGWNEIYMGEAGWVPVDATAMEFDYVDSGHIRIGVLGNTTIAFNPHEMKVLDYRVGEGEDGSETASLEDKYKSYLGNYKGVERNQEMELLIKDNSLSLDLKGRMVLAFNEPDEQGKWTCKIAPHVFLNFEEEDGRKITAMFIHEVITMPRKSDPETVSDYVPEDIRPLLGKYYYAAVNADFRVEFVDGSLGVYNPMEKRTVKLQPPDENGWRLDEFNKNSILFEMDDEGQVKAMKIDSASRANRK